MQRTRPITGKSSWTTSWTSPEWTYHHLYNYANVVLCQMIQLILICGVSEKVQNVKKKKKIRHRRLRLLIWMNQDRTLNLCKKDLTWGVLNSSAKIHKLTIQNDAKMPTIDQRYSKYFQTVHPPSSACLTPIGYTPSPSPFWNWLNSKQTSRGRNHVESSVVVSCPRWHPSEIAHLFPLMDAGLSH